jgi:hypothetical protein
MYSSPPEGPFLNEGTCRALTGFGVLVIVPNPWEASLPTDGSQGVSCLDGPAMRSEATYG